ncbi:MAG: T9SS type A sorting domain-containing protein [Candidatus Delongbacteria bacterium]|nr:T9SS type A sorting domain-containing protein [Candidatus Delongbacteria bacterium]
MKFYLFLIILHCWSVFGQVSPSRVERRTFLSNSLGVEKQFKIYLPSGYDESFTNYPVVYFLRNHEDEWFAGGYSGRDGTALKEVIDGLIDSEIIGNLIIIAPNTGSTSGGYAGLGVNMLRPDLIYGTDGIGTGLFEDYIIELTAYVDEEFRTIPDRNHRGIDGFSLGGYSSTMLALKHPELFCSVGSYDGTLMWLDLDDLTKPWVDDDWWMYDNYVTNPVFNNPRDVSYLLLHSASNILNSADSDKLDSIRTVRFHISCVSQIVGGNRAPNMQFMSIMRQKGIWNRFEKGVLHPTASHTYGNADLHATGSLINHWQAFNGTQISTPGIVEFSTVDCEIGATTEVVIFNYGPDSITVSSIYNSEGVYQLEDVPYLPKTLCAGDTLSFNVEFNPLKNIIYTDMIQITSNDPITPISKIILHGEGINEVSIAESMPSTFQIYQNYPNPFNPSTTIEYSINKKSHVELYVYNSNGEFIRRLVNGIQETGSYNVEFNAEQLSVGLYFYELRIDGISARNKKMLFLK